MSPLGAYGAVNAALLVVRVGVVWSGNVRFLTEGVLGAEKVFQGPCVVGVVGDDFWFWCTVGSLL